MKNLLLVEHGGDAKSFIFEMIRRSDVELYLACTYIPSWILEYVPKDRIIVTDTYDAEKLMSSVGSFADSRGTHFDGVGTFYEHVVVQTALLGKRLGVVHLDPEAARKSSSNKLLMRETCRAAGIPTPLFKTIQNPSKASLQTALEDFSLPAVIKPIFGSQSYGVKKIESKETIVADIDEVMHLTTSSNKEVFKNFEGTFLIEEYLAGKVISVDGVIEDKNIHVAGLIEFVMGPEPHFTQEANYLPGRFGKETAERCFEMATRIVQALGFDNCGFHCEMRLTDNGPVLIEIAARLPGGPLQLGYQKAFGYNLASEMVKLWLGEPVAVVKKYERFVLQKAVFPRTRAIVKEILGTDTLLGNAHIWDSLLISKVGEETITYPEIPKPLYYYALEANSREELDALSDEVERAINFVLE